MCGCALNDSLPPYRHVQSFGRSGGRDHRPVGFLIVWNRTATKTGSLVALGARAATTAREAAAAADVVITSLMDDKSVLDVVRAGDGVLAGMRPHAVHACVTTISPECADELESLHRGHGSFYVSAPVAGRPDAAASGRLASFLGGPANAVERLMPACKSYSTSVTVISERPRMANVCATSISSFGSPIRRRRCMPRSCSSVTSPAAAGL